MAPPLVQRLSSFRRMREDDEDAEEGQNVEWYTGDHEAPGDPFRDPFGPFTGFGDDNDPEEPVPDVEEEKESSSDGAN